MMDKITRWVQREICDQVKLKLPDDNHSDASYNDHYTLVHPMAFPLYVPTKDRLQPRAVAPIPSVCIQMLSGSEAMINQKGTLKLRLCFAAWDPGEHAGDIFKPKKGKRPKNAYEQLNGPEALEYYARRSEGWRDVWNFVDTALRVLENAEYLEGYRIIKEQGIEYGPVAEEDSIPDFYPYWFAWVSFSVQYGIIRKADLYQEYL
jgi:hypothetical protein